MFLRQIVLLFLCISAIGVKAQKELDNAYLLELYQTGKFIEAADYIKNAYPDIQYNAQALNSLAYSYQMAGNYADAEKAYMSIYEKDTTSISTLMNLASVNAKRGNEKKALHFYNKVLDIDSTNLTVYQRLSEIEINRKQMIPAYNYLLKANDIEPGNATIAYNLGMIAINMTFYPKADSVIERALKDDPENINLLYGKAVCKDYLKAYPEAIETCELLLDLGSDSLRVLPILGPIYFYNKNYEKCIELYTWLENETDQINESSMYYMAVSYWNTGENEKGFEYMEGAIMSSISPNTARYYTEKADKQHRLGQNKLAVESYKRSLDFKINPAVLYSIGLLFDYHLHEKENALHYYNRFLKEALPDTQDDIVKFVQSRVKDLN